MSDSFAGFGRYDGQHTLPGCYWTSFLLEPRRPGECHGGTPEGTGFGKCDSIFAVEGLAVAGAHQGGEVQNVLSICFSYWEIGLLQGPRPVSQCLAVRGYHPKCFGF